MSETEPGDPLGVRAGARFVVARSDLVVLDPEAIRAFCADLARQGPPSIPGWEAGTHYLGDYASTVAYTFVLDTLNFCFWGDPKWQIAWRGGYLDGYWALAAALARQVGLDPAFLDAGRLAALDTDALGAVLAGEPPIPLLAERAANLRELGRWIGAAFGGDFAAVLPATGWNAIRLVERVVAALASFRDVARYDGVEVPFYKRAQILAADLQGVLGSQGWGTLAGMPDLTAFADYKVPQILRHLGILRYAPLLAARVDARLPLPAGSREEVQIRAGTVRAVDLIRQEFAGFGFVIPDYQIDWLLWLGSQDSSAMQPYHRTVTIFY